MPKLCAWLLLLLMCGALPTADAEPKEPDTSELATERGSRFLERIASMGEARALDRLETDGEDPWIIAEELLLLGKPEEAGRLARATLTGADAALATYVDRAPPPAVELAQQAARAERLLAAGNATEANAALPKEIPQQLTVTVVRALRTRANALKALGRIEDSTAALGALTDVVDAMGWRRASIGAYRELLDRRGAGDRSNETRRILSRLVGLDRDSRDIARSALWCARLGRLESRRGQAGLARTWLLEAEGLLAALADNAELSAELQGAYADTLITLAVVQMRLGDAGLSLATAFRAYDRAKTLDPNRRIGAARSLARAFKKVKRWEEAERYQREAIALAKEASSRHLVGLQGDLALLMLIQGEQDEAQALYDAVDASDIVRHNKRLAYTARLHRASASIDRPEDERSVEGLQRALIDLSNMRRDLEKEPSTFNARAEMEANAKALIGRALNLLNRSGEALPLLRDVVASARDNVVLRALLPYVRLELARALRRNGQAAEGLALTTSAVSDLRNDVDKVLPSHAISLLSNDSVSELIREHMAMVLAIDEPQATADALEATRGMAFLSEVGRRQRGRGDRKQQLHADTIGALARDVAHAARTYWEILDRRAPRIEMTKARDALWEKRKRLRHAEERAGIAWAAAARKKRQARTDIPFRTPPALRGDEVILYYAEPAEQAAAILLRQERRHVISLGPRAALEARMEEALATWLDDDAKARDKALDTLLAGVLPTALLDRLTSGAPDTRRISHIYVSVVGNLARLPWPVLIREALTRAGVKPSEVPTISLVASQGVLRHLRTWNRGAGDGPLLAIGDPDYTTEGTRRRQMRFFGRTLPRLRASGEEARALVDPDRGDLLLLGDQACEPLLQRCLFDAPYPIEVLHFSCHGLLYGETPWLSGLALHATANDDGLLTVEDVAQWQFQGGPGLVVLAACQSGLGAPIPGEGEEGLVRAFQLAGARHVVASLWNVPDQSSRDLMIAFHRHRRTGMSPAAALARAQEGIRTSSKDAYRDPIAWAGWAVWGPRD